MYIHKVSRIYMLHTCVNMYYHSLCGLQTIKIIFVVLENILGIYVLCGKGQLSMPRIDPVSSSGQMG